MRISDWSSVVCSSDLPVSGQAVKDVGGDQRVVVKIILAVLIIAAQEEIQRPVEIRREAKLLADGFETIVLQHDEPAVNGLVERRQIDRKSVVEGKSVTVRVDLGGRRIIKKKNKEGIKRYKVAQRHIKHKRD